MLPLLFRAPRSLALPAALLILAPAGCGSSSQPQAETTPETREANQAKVRELSKKGYNLRDIQAIMKGEKPEPKGNKKAGRGGR